LGELNFALNCFFQNGDFPVIFANPYLCLHSCEKNPSCTHFTFNTSNGECSSNSGSVLQIDGTYQIGIDTICAILSKIYIFYFKQLNKKP